MMKQLVFSVMLGYLYLLPQTGISASYTFLGNDTNPSIMDVAQWDDGEGHGMTPADPSAAGSTFTVSGKNAYTENNTDTVLTPGAVLSIENAGTITLLSSTQTGTGGERAHDFSLLKLNRSNISSSTSTTSTQRTNWNITSPIELADECVLVRNSAAVQTFTLSGALSGTGLFAFQSNSSYNMTINLSGAGAYQGIFSFERLGSSASCTVNITANQGPLELLEIRAKDEPATRRTELCTGNNWTINTEAGALDGVRKIDLRRHASSLNLKGDQSIGTMQGSGGSLNATAGFPSRLTIDQATDEVMSLSLSGPLSIVKRGEASITFPMNNNTASGSLLIEDGTLIAATNNSLNFGEGVTLTGGILKLEAEAPLTVTPTSLTLNSGAIFDLTLEKATGSDTAVTGDLTIEDGATITATFIRPPQNGTYPLIQSENAISGSAENLLLDVTAPDAPPRTIYALVIRDNTLFLEVARSEARDLTWATTSGNWSTNTDDNNWLDDNSTQTAFIQGDNVTFGDIPGSGDAAIAVTGNVFPGTVLFENALGSYTFNPEGSVVISATALTAEPGSSATFNLPVEGGLILAESVSLAFNEGLFFPAAQPLVLGAGSTLTAKKSKLALAEALTLNEGAALILDGTFGNNADADSLTVPLTFGADSRLAFETETAITQTIGVNMSGPGEINIQGEGSTLTLNSYQGDFTGKIRITGGAILNCKETGGTNGQTGLFGNALWATEIPLYADNGGVIAMARDNICGWVNGGGHNFAELGEGGILRMATGNAAEGFFRVVTLSGSAMIENDSTSNGNRHQQRTPARLFNAQVDPIQPDDLYGRQWNNAVEHHLAH